MTPTSPRGLGHLPKARPHLSKSTRPDRRATKHRNIQIRAADRIAEVTVPGGHPSPCALPIWLDEEHHVTLRSRLLGLWRDRMGPLRHTELATLGPRRT